MHRQPQNIRLKIVTFHAINISNQIVPATILFILQEQQLFLLQNISDRVLKQNSAIFA